MVRRISTKHSWQSAIRNGLIACANSVSALRFGVTMFQVEWNISECVLRFCLVLLP